MCRILSGLRRKKTRKCIKVVTEASLERPEETRIDQTTSVVQDPTVLGERTYLYFAQNQVPRVEAQTC